MTQATIRAAIVAAAAGLILASCGDGTGPAAGGPSIGASDAGDAPVARAAMPGRLVERDVEAPEIFQASDAALWDGRPSLGGVWVASPDVVDPERVIIRNPDNGNFVIGALFRRERLNPGPTLQISSDAAAALGILAGAPTEIEVVALRRTDAAEPEPVSGETAEVAVTGEDLPAPEAAEDIGAAAVAALDQSGEEATASDTIVADTDLSAAPDAEAPGEAVAAAADELAAPAADSDKPRKKKRKWFWQKAPAEAVVAAALPAGEAVADGTQLAAVGTAEIAATALPAPGSNLPVSAPTEAPAVAALPAGGALIQIGFYSVEENAQRTVDKLSTSGVSARVLTEQAKGKTFWRVVAGPGADAALLEKVKSAGFADAYFVRG